MLSLTKEQYNELNKPNAILVIMIIRIFLGVFFSYSNIMLISYIDVLLYTVLTITHFILLIILVVTFFIHSKFFVICYIIAIIFAVMIGLCFQTNIIGTLIVDGFFILYLLLSKRAAIVFKLKKFKIIDETNGIEDDIVTINENLNDSVLSGTEDINKRILFALNELNELKQQKIIDQEQFEKKYKRLCELKSKNDLSVDKNKLENSSKQDKDTN